MNWQNGNLCDQRGRSAREAHAMDLMSGHPKQLPEAMANRQRKTRKRLHDLDDRRFLAQRCGDL